MRQEMALVIDDVLELFGARRGDAERDADATAG